MVGSRQLASATVVALSAVGMISCVDTDDPSGVNAGTWQPQTSAFALSTQSALPEAALSATLTVNGSLRPGQPLHITARITPNVAVAEVEAVLWAPEVEYARATGWGDDYKVPVGVSVPPVATRSGGAGRLVAPMVFSSVLNIEAPGAYEIVLSVKSKPLVSTFRVNGTIQESVWVYISEDGGSISSTFEPKRLKEGVLPVPGPHRAARPGRPNGMSVDAAAANGQVKVQLYFNENGSPVAVHGAVVEIHERAYPSGPIVKKTLGATNAQGIATLSCNEFFLDIYPHLMGSKASWTEESATAGACDSPPITFTFNVGGLGRVFLNLEHNIIPTVNAAFGVSRPVIMFVPTTAALCSYTYFPGVIEVINIANSCIWGAGGLATQAHEYGHALHEKGLDGNTGRASCPGPHTYNLRTNYKCAWSEGFAEYVALSTGYLTPAYPAYGDAYFVDQHCLSLGPAPFFQCTQWGTVADHLEVEGAVMAFLNDVSDSNNPESYDNVTISQAHVAAIIKTCQVNYTSWRRPDRIHWLTHCIQRQIDGYGSGFPANEQPSGYAVNSGHVVSSADVRSLWRWHFFNAAGAQQPPALVASIVGPSAVAANANCTWQAGVSGGTAPYSYAWYRDGAFVSPSSTYSGNTGTSDFLLRLQVTDAASQLSTKDLVVSVLSQVTCPE